MQTGFNDADQAVSTTYPDGDVVNTVYTANDWLSGATEVLGGTTTTLMSGTVYSGSSGANGQPSQYTVGNGLYTMNLGYDRDHRLNSVQATLTSNNSVLYSQNRSFDAAGNTVNQQTTVQGQTDNEVFCYDALNRLIWAGSTGTPSCGTSLTTGTLAAHYTQTYGYDTSWRLTQGPSGSGYTYGNSAHPQAVTSTAGGYTAAYDAAGDMTCRALTTATTCAGGSPTGQTLSYDAERNLLQWQNKPSGATSYTQNAYTGSGDRVWQQVTNGSTTTTTLYLGTAEEIVTTGSTTTVTKYYYAGDRKVAQRVGSTLTYLVADGLSSVTQALSTTGTVVATHLFAPYGTVRYSQGTMPTAYGFTGTRLDASGLNALGERFYDPVVGQFVSADQTLPGSGAILGGLNRFAYVTGNPETATDPGGEWGFGSIFKAVTNVVKAAAPAVVHFVQAAAPVVASVADSALGISSMIGDVKTLFDPSKSWTDKLLSVADLAVNVAMDVDTVTGTGEAARAAYMGLKVGVKMAGKAAEHAAVDEAEHLAVKEGEHAVEGEGEHLADTVESCALHSFAGNTLVATPNGAVSIDALKLGDQVLATDVATGKVQAEPVQNVMIHLDSNLLDVTIAAAPTAKPATQDTTNTQQQDVATKAHGAQAPPTTTETLHTTTEHPFLTAELGWVNAQDLTPGEHVRNLDGSLGVVTAVTVVTGTAVRYNLTVASDHTFAVGDGQWVVHNCGDIAKTIEDLGLDKTKRVTVVGRGMGRVRDAAQQLRDAGFEVNTWETKIEEPTREANRSWLRYWAKKSQSQIVDILDGGITEPSKYYELEKRSLYTNWKGLVNVTKWAF